MHILLDGHEIRHTRTPKRLAAFRHAARITVKQRFRRLSRVEEHLIRRLRDRRTRRGRFRIDTAVDLAMCRRADVVTFRPMASLAAKGIGSRRHRLRLQGFYMPRSGHLLGEHAVHIVVKRKLLDEVKSLALDAHEETAAIMPGTDLKDALGTLRHKTQGCAGEALAIEEDSRPAALQLDGGIRRDRRQHLAASVLDDGKSGVRRDEHALLPEEQPHANLLRRCVRLLLLHLFGRRLPLRLPCALKVDHATRRRRMGAAEEQAAQKEKNCAAPHAASLF